MRKHLHILLFIVTGIRLNAGIPELILQYRVKSDTINTSVKKGFTKIYGTVLKDGKPIANARVSSVDHKYFSVSDSNGHYAFLIPSKDTSIYVYKPHHDEVVTSRLKLTSQHQVEVEFYLTDNIDNIIMDKPVIYLYSDEDGKEVDIALTVNGHLSFTYPNYMDGWSVQANKNGSITHKGKDYPYLFWEGETRKKNYTTPKVLGHKFANNIQNESRVEELDIPQGLDFIETSGQVNGFAITGDSCISFLEEKLDLLGLNQKEKTDFITFWAPRMVKHNLLLVQFLVDEEYSANIAEIEVTPKPTSSRRIYMLFKPCDEVPLNITEQKFTPFIRKGFTLIEWGGSELQKTKNYDWAN